LFRLFLTLLKDNSGISSVEYAMLLAMAASGIFMAVEYLSSSVADQFADTASCFDGSAKANGGQGGGNGDGGGSGSGSGQGAGTGAGFTIC
jgi:Flp pilus assembly pilin Flp